MENRSTGTPRGAMRLRQAAIIFSEIGQLAICVDRLAIMLVMQSSSRDDERDDRDITALHTAVKAIAGQVGYMADTGSKLTGGATWYDADASKWLLPPVFQDEGEQQ